MLRSWHGAFCLAAMVARLMAGHGAELSLLRSKKKVTCLSWLCCYTPCMASDEEYAPPEGPWSMYTTHPDMAALSGMYRK